MAFTSLFSPSTTPSYGLLRLDLTNTWRGDFFWPVLPQLLCCRESRRRGPRRQFWRNKNQQFIFTVIVGSPFEEPPQPGSVSEIRNAPLILPEVVLQDAAQDEGVPFM